jgi:hypothetical protein
MKARAVINNSIHRNCIHTIDLAIQVSFIVVMQLRYHYLS